MGDKIYVMGGKTLEGITRTVLKYDLRTLQLEDNVPDMLCPRFGSSAVAIDGKIYVFGGDTIASQSPESLNCMRSVEVFDGKVWRYIPSMKHKRLGSSAVVVDGKAIVMGGYDGEYHNTVEMYDPKTNKWSMPFAKMIQSRYAASAVTFRNYIYVIGGFQNSVLRSVERLNMITNKWEPLAKLNTRRSGMSALCYHGKILVLGGSDGSRNLCSAEEFDPCTETFKISRIRLRTNLALFGSHVVRDL
jgi:N-acetylneuraminic acid mutarotase